MVKVFFQTNQEDTLSKVHSISSQESWEVESYWVKSDKDNSGVKDPKPKPGKDSLQNLENESHEEDINAPNEAKKYHGISPNN